MVAQSVHDITGSAHGEEARSMEGNTTSFRKGTMKCLLANMQAQYSRISMARERHREEVAGEGSGKELKV
jgi:hypothetical protein